MKEMKLTSIDWRRMKELAGSRTAMLSVMIAALVVTGALSLRYAVRGSGETKWAQESIETSSSSLPDQAETEEVTEETAEEPSAAAFFSDYRTERNSVRAQEIACLDSVITSASAREEARTEAQDKKLALADRMEKEVTLEGLLRAKGFPEAIVTVTEENVNVVVGNASLNEAEAAQILEIVTSETDIGAEHVKIIPAG